MRGPLADRVEQRLAGRRVGRAVIDAAVDRVISALAARSAVPNVERVMALSASGLPDLASRVRAALVRAGIVPLQMAYAHAGRHTVVTLQVAESECAGIERIASELGVGVSSIAREEIA